MPDFPPTQGRYLAFISAYTGMHGYPPAESEIAAAMCVSPLSVNGPTSEEFANKVINRVIEN